jgi:hypothetical protein
MSWLSIFPFLDDSGLDVFEGEVSPAERDTLAGHFRVAEVYNRKDGEPARHVVAASLFWKPLREKGVELPPLTCGMKLDSKQETMTRYSNPWEHYVEPLFEGAKSLAETRPDVVFRVYLANDLAHLIPELTAAGCEVHLMESSSLGMQPGMMWRFLALEHDGLVTITDSDRATEVINDVERTELMAEAGLGFWRVPYTCGREETRQALPSHYRPILASQFGSARSFPLRDLMMAFLWHSERGTLPTHLTLGEKKQELWGTRWPDYGFDEWFLQTVFFPRMAFEGILTFVAWEDRALNHWFALDIEYCTWANPNSEILHHDSPQSEKVTSLKKKTLRMDENTSSWFNSVKQ